MHYSSGTVRQDSFALTVVEQPEGSPRYLVAALADGVSQATHSHQLADWLCRQAAALAGEALVQNGVAAVADVDWQGLCRNLQAQALDFCRRSAESVLRKGADPSQLSLRQILSRWASTLEFAVVEIKEQGPYPFVAVTAAGDGAAWLLHGQKGFQTLKSGKRQTGQLASNAVTALPADPGPALVTFGQLGAGEALLLVTDGLGDMLGDGGTALGGFFQSKLPSCRSLPGFVQAMDVALFQADDDRTGILIKEA
ncbi:MAG: protein phosphatase 2C domain-containing protein, partial [Clostridia bacterium]|nr:protein phosphatase 2C domain-containing protein [Clostridia bacterium]